CHAGSEKPNKADRRVIEEFATPGLVPLSGEHATFENMKLGLAHRSLEPEQEPVVVVAGIVEPILVGQERLKDRTQLQELVPVLARPCKTAHLDSQNEAHVIEAYLGEEPLETEPAFDRLATPTLVLIDDEHPVCRPAQGHRATPQVVLERGRLTMFEYL